MSKSAALILLLAVLVMSAGLVVRSRMKKSAPSQPPQLLSATVELVFWNRAYLHAAAPITDVKLMIDGSVRCGSDGLEPGDHPLTEEVLNDIAIVRVDSTDSMVIQITAIDNAVDTTFQMTILPAGRK